jgi:hypothetical protein
LPGWDNDLDAEAATGTEESIEKGEKYPKNCGYYDDLVLDCFWSDAYGFTKNAR